LGFRSGATADPRVVEDARDALARYAQSAQTHLQRFFVRMRIDRTTGVLFQPEATLDDAARSVLRALGRIFAEYDKTG
jgi:hypothetical protein